MLTQCKQKDPIMKSTIMWLLRLSSWHLLAFFSEFTQAIETSMNFSCCQCVKVTMTTVSTGQHVTRCSMLMKLPATFPVTISLTSPSINSIQWISLHKIEFFTKTSPLYYHFTLFSALSNCIYSSIIIFYPTVQCFFLLKFTWN